MPQRTINNSWREEHEATKYPFSESATMQSQNGQVLLEGTFLDAAIHPVGGQAGLRLSRVTLTNSTLTVFVGDPANPTRCSGSIELGSPASDIPLFDIYGRPAGLLISEPIRLASLQGWGLGEHNLPAGAAEFVASVCFPTPEVGLRGFLLETGEVVAGDVWLIGEDGIVIRTENDSLPQPCEHPVTGRIIRFDAIGDPLFRRRLCAGAVDFRVPRFITSVRFLYPGGEFEIGPDEQGDLQLTAHNALEAATVLRVRPRPSGAILEMAGSPLREI